MDFGNFFSFHGRIGRDAFWGLAVLGTIVYAGGVAMLAHVESSSFLLFPGLAAVAAGMVIQWSSTVKRWHDRDKSGWWMLISLFPTIGAFWTLIEEGFLSGTPGYNQYGASASGSPFGDRSPVVRRDPLARMRP